MKLLAKVHNADAAKSGRWGLGRKVAGNAAEAVGNAAKVAGNAAKAARQCGGDPKINGESSKINGHVELREHAAQRVGRCAEVAQHGVQHPHYAP